MPLSQSLLAEETESFLAVSPRPSSKLRGRIMAAGYRYKLLDESNRDLDSRAGSDQACCCCSSRGLFVWLCLVCSLFMGLLIVFLVLLLGDLGGGLQDGDCGNLGKACLSPGCIKTSAEILSKMDPEVDPCSDMYHYACGGWIKETTMPPGQYKINQFSQASERNNDFLRKFLEGDSIEFKGRNLTSLTKLKTAYQSCMDTASLDRVGITALVEVINSLGSWTVVQGVNDISRWDEGVGQWDLQDTLATSHNLWGSALFAYGLQVDAKNTSQRILAFSQAGITLSSREEYLKEDSKQFEDGFLEYATQVAVLLGGNAETSRQKMQKVYDLEKELARIFLPRSEMTNPLDMYNKMTLKEFQAMVGPWIDLKKYLQMMFRGRQFPDSENIIVSTPSYFKNLSSIVLNTDKEVLANYLMWNTLQGFMGFLPDSFMQARFPLSQVETGISELPERWKRCTSYAKFVLGFAASAVYVDAKFSAADKAKVLKTIENIREDFIDNLPSVQWLDDVTRARLREKARAVVFNIGYPDWILDPDQLDGYYNKLEIKKDTLLENRLCTIRFLTDMAISRYGTTPDKTEWSEFPFAVNGFYSSVSNMIMMPAGILQAPFFSSYSPKPYLYSTIGMVVGHELTHAFDNSGRMFDKDGNLGKQQWTPEAANMYRSNARCIEDQYSGFSLQGVHVNGKTTLNENIADNGAIRLALSAYQKDDDHKGSWTLPGVNLTDNQMFFLGYAQIMCAIYTPQYQIEAITTDVHSYPEFRIKGVYNNMPEFSKAFNCPKADVGQQEPEVCRVW